uniref:Putative secreted protein n=1 Tax=Ixodes ricinus TaxID=34613 RepID=A0A6B0UM37_IXORI
MSNPLIFFTQLLIAQAAFACPLSRQHDPADRSVTVPLSSLKTTQGNVSGTTFHTDSEDDSRNKRLVFDESTRSASTSTVAYEATKGLSERFAIRGQSSTHVCTMSNPLIFFTQICSC